MIKLFLIGKTDKYTTFRMEIDSEPVGELQVPDDKVMGLVYRLMDNPTIQ